MGPMQCSYLNCLLPLQLKTFHILLKTELSSKVVLRDDYYPICAWKQEEPGALAAPCSRVGQNIPSQVPQPTPKRIHQEVRCIKIFQPPFPPLWDTFVAILPLN